MPELHSVTFLIYSVCWNYFDQSIVVGPYWLVHSGVIFETFYFIFSKCRPLQ